METKQEIEIELDRMFKVMGRDAKNPEQYQWFVAFINKNIPSERVAEFVNECIATFNIATPKQMKELFEAQREYYKKTFHRNTPTQDEPIETWCRMCMNLGVVHVHEIHEGHSVDMPYRCNCPAGDAFRWMPVYTTQYPVDPQFQWDGKEFYWLTYKKAVAELSRENANRKETKPTAYNETIRIQTKKRYDDLPF